MFCRFALTLAAAVLLSACASVLPDAHKIEIQQGNVLDPEAISKLELGMSREQVRFLLGNPSLTDLFHPDRWDYIHYTTRAGQAAAVSRLTLFFDADRLRRIEDLRQPDQASAP